MQNEHAPLGDLEALVHSLGLHFVQYVGQMNLRSLSVALDNSDMSVDVDIQLRDDTENSRFRALSQLLDVEEMFMDEVSMDFHFVTSNADAETALAANKAIYVYA